MFEGENQLDPKETGFSGGEESSVVGNSIVPERPIKAMSIKEIKALNLTPCPAPRWERDWLRVARSGDEN